MKFEQIDLGKIAEVLTGFPFKSKEFNEEGLGYFLIRGKNVSESFIKKGKDAKFWNHNLDKKMEKYLLKENDIVIGMDGSKVGKNVSKISTGEVPSLLVQRVARLRVKEGYDQNFLYYHFFNNRFNNYVNSIKTGTSIPHISPKQISEYQVTNFPINEQKRVVSIIEPILEKIELNNQIIATLEELAATLFKRWFVDFEFPDENGNPYKSSGGKMVDSELGEIPEGWITTTLGSQVSFEYGKSLTKSQRNFGTIPVYGSNGIVDYHDKELVSGPGIIIGRKGTVGTVNFSSKDFYPIDTTFWVKILTDTKPINYFYFLLKNLNLDNLTSDSAVPGLNRNTALRTEIVVPTERAINHFERTVETFRYLSDEIEDNIGSLGDVRDSLLFKILLGEIEV